MRYGGNNNTAIARYTLAVERSFKQESQPSADFISCVALGKQGEFAEKYLRKGMKMVIEGHWQTGNYTNKDGVKVYTNDCVVEKHEFGESKSSSNESAAPTTGGIQGGINTSSDGFMTIPDSSDEELPFN